MFDKRFMKTAVMVLLLAVAAIVLSSCTKDTPTNDDTPDAKTPDAKVPDAKVPDAKVPDAKVPDSKVPDAKVPDAKDGNIALPVELPEAILGGTPIPVPELDNLAKDASEVASEVRPTFFVPEGTTNVALNKTVTCPDEDITPEELKIIVDGDMSGTDGTWVELGLYEQQVTIDLGSQHEINAILLWHYFKEARVYLDVVIQTADDADFVTNLKTHFNSDTEDIHGQGVGTDKYYIEMPKGKLIDAKGIKARYVRLFSNTNSINDLNHYVEVAVFGKPVK